MNARRNFNKLLLLIVAAQFCAAVLAFAQPKAYTVRKEDSHIEFSIYKWGVFKEEGRFTDFSGSFVYDRSNPAACSVEFILQATSIDSRNDRRDRAIRSHEFFHVERYPTLSFKSTQVEAGGSDTLLVTGDLTMRGVTKRITIPVKVLGTQQVRELGELAGFESTLMVNREDFGIARVGDHWQRGDDSPADRRWKQPPECKSLNRWSIHMQNSIQMKFLPKGRCTYNNK